MFYSKKGNKPFPWWHYLQTTLYGMMKWFSLPSSRCSFSHKFIISNWFPNKPNDAAAIERFGDKFYYQPLNCKFLLIMACRPEILCNFLVLSLVFYNISISRIPSKHFFLKCDESTFTILYFGNHFNEMLLMEMRKRWLLLSLQFIYPLPVTKINISQVLSCVSFYSFE